MGICSFLGCPQAHNERLAWLGDAVLEQEASRVVFRTYPTADSNRLSLYRQELVSNPACARVVRASGLWRCILARIPQGDSGFPEKVIPKIDRIVLPLKSVVWEVVS